MVAAYEHRRRRARSPRVSCAGRQFAETLIEALERFDAPVIVYSSYEQTRLRELAEAFPELRASLDAIIARLVDLLPIVRGAVYFPEFGYSYSIKSVAPALALVLASEVPFRPTRIRFAGTRSRLFSIVRSAPSDTGVQAGAMGSTGSSFPSSDSAQATPSQM